MARFTRTVQRIVSAPLILAAELQRFREDSACPIPASSREAIASTVVTAVRHALRADGEELAPRAVALAHDVRDLVPVLHVHARTAAKLRGHQEPGDAESRAHRWVEWLTGGRRYDDRSRVDWPCPAAMEALVPFATRANVRSSLGLLYRLCTIAGVGDAPRRFPTYERLLECAAETLGAMRAGTEADVEALARGRVTEALSAYRKAREVMLARAAEGERARLREQFAPCPRPPIGRAVHVGVHEEVHALLRAQGLVPEEMSPFEILRAINPALAEDLEQWRDGPGAALSESYREQCEDALLRAAGWAVAAGRLDPLLAAQGIDDLFAMQVETKRTLALSPRARRAARANGDHAGAVGIEQVSLLQMLVEAAASDALRRSPVTGEDVPLDESGRPYIIHGIYAVCTKLWTVARDLYARAAAQNPDDARRWSLASAHWTHLLATMKARRVPAEHIVSAKDKEKLIRLVTLPPLLCVGFPLRRRELAQLRVTWQEARAAAIAKGHSPDDHPGVLRAERAYFAQAVPHLMLATALDDGLRRQQYQHGRLGYRANFRPTFRRAGGRADGEIVGIEAVRTHWTGDRRDPAHLKIRMRGGKLDSREDRELRPGVVEMNLLWDVIRYHRPRQLVAAGLVESLASYDLDADMRAGLWALFPSERRVRRAEQSRTDVSELAGRELHYIVRSFLRPPGGEHEPVPEWDELDVGFRAVWALHVTRLINTSYIGGVRHEWNKAAYLARDTEETLRREYTVVNSAIEDRLGLDTTHWEHPRAYDSWMDRLLWGKEAFDPLADPALPLPDHVRAMLHEQRVIARRVRMASVPRVQLRAARPGQAPPRRDGRG